MPRPVTLFTGQWADLPLEKLAPLVKSMGYDGVELACWGDHFDVDAAATSNEYVHDKWALLKDHGLTCYAISSHLVGQAICDRIDERHKSILPADVWGDGDPEGVRKRAARKMITAGRAARAFFDAKPGSNGKDPFPAVVNGFTGSSIWHSIYAFPPTSQAYWDAGFADFGKRFGPILEAFEKSNVNFALEVHPTEIAFDIASAPTRDRRRRRPQAFRLQLRPLPPRLPGRRLREVHPRLRQPHLPRPHEGRLVGPRRRHRRRLRRPRELRPSEPLLGLPLARPRRHQLRGNHRRPQRRRLPRPLSVEWEDSRMDRVHGATEASAFVRKVDFPSSAIVFDAQFDKKG